MLRKAFSVVLVSLFLLPCLGEAEGWRFWKRKSEVVPAEATAGPVEEQVVARAEMDRDKVEKQIRSNQKKRAKEEKKRQDEMARALRKKEREMAKQQRDVERKQEKLQRAQQRRLKDLTRRYEGRRSWQFWKRSDQSNDFFISR